MSKIILNTKFSIKDIIRIKGLSLISVSQKLEIPCSVLKKWCKETQSLPKYLEKLIIDKLLHFEEDFMFLDMTIKEVIQAKKIAVYKVAKILGVPLRTMQSWYYETRKPTKYVQNLIVDKILSL